MNEQRLGPDPGDPTGWFDRLYLAAGSGDAVVPWDRGRPHPLVEHWVQRYAPDGAGRRAVVVGAGPGYDAELLGARGFATTAFDVAPTAVKAARARFPGSRVRYCVADLLDLPGDWIEAYDLVVEVLTVQSLPDPPRGAAIAQVGRLVAPGGTLLVGPTARRSPTARRGRSRARSSMRSRRAAWPPRASSGSTRRPRRARAGAPCCGGGERCAPRSSGAPSYAVSAVVTGPERSRLRS